MRLLRPPRSPSSSLLMLPAIMILAILCLLVVPALFQDHHRNAAHAAEVVATKDWTLLGENDTVAAGMHIRMDLETGQKWVKLVSEEEVDDNPDEASASASGRQRQASSSSAVVVTVDGESTTTTTTTGDRQFDDGSATSSSTSGYDFDMMHRTLDQLPDEEKVRIGLPAAPPTAMTPEQRGHFEETMARIWQRRQEELQKFQDEFVADLPQVLRDRIERLRQYVNDPVQELADMDRATASASSRTQDDSGPAVTHIVSVLADLEYHLSDIDMTRDFYTLGGWPYLVAMLRDDTHRAGSGNASATNGVDDDDATSAKVHAVQAHAAWALGTAVKNTGEFASFVVEPVPALTVTHEATPLRSALQVLIDQITTVDVWDASKPHQDKVHKYLYALGSFVRGNPTAQRQFVEHQGPEALGRLLDAHVATATAAASRKVVHRIVSLVDDVVRETHDPSRPPAEALADELVRGLSTPAWCDSTLVVLRQAAVPPGDVNVLSSSSLPAMRVLRAIAPHCHAVDREWPAQARAVTSRLLQQWQDELAAAATSRRAQEADVADAGDNHGPEDLQEGIDLAESVLSVLEDR